MKLKYSPQYAPLRLCDTKIVVINESTVQIDGEEYSFDASVSWPNVVQDTKSAIFEAHRDSSGELHLTILRQYTGNCTAWDDGLYHSVEPEQL